MANDCVACKYIRYFFRGCANCYLDRYGQRTRGLSPLDFIKIDVGDYLAGGIPISLICLIGYRIYISTTYHGLTGKRLETRLFQRKRFCGD